MSPIQPPPPLKYPPPHWLITSFAVARLGDFTTVTISTDVALHLSAEVSPVPPAQSNVTRIRRGMVWDRDKHWSFTPFGLISQTEEGDTLTHSYSIPIEIRDRSLWMRFAHDYEGMYRCPADGSILYNRLDELHPTPGGRVIISHWLCDIGSVNWTLTQINIVSGSKSTSPFFEVPPI